MCQNEYPGRAGTLTGQPEQLPFRFLPVCLLDLNAGLNNPDRSLGVASSHPGTSSRYSLYPAKWCFRCRLVLRRFGLPPLEREDRVLDVPDVLHHRYPEVVALPAVRGEPEVDDREPGEREEHQDRDCIGEEAGGGAVGEDGDDTAGAKRKGILPRKGGCHSSSSVSSQSSSSSSSYSGSSSIPSAFRI
jgi:hypothetical protein